MINNKSCVTILMFILIILTIAVHSIDTIKYVGGSYNNDKQLVFNIESHILPYSQSSSSGDKYNICGKQYTYGNLCYIISMITAARLFEMDTSDIFKNNNPSINSKISMKKYFTNMINDINIKDKSNNNYLYNVFDKTHVEIDRMSNDVSDTFIKYMSEILTKRTRSGFSSTIKTCLKIFNVPTIEHCYENERTFKILHQKNKPIYIIYGLVQQGHAILTRFETISNTNGKYVIKCDIYNGLNNSQQNMMLSTFINNTNYKSAIIKYITHD